MKKAKTGLRRVLAYFVGLAVVLTTLWLGLSGLYKPLMLTLGAISILLSLLLAARFRTLDAESAPYFRLIPIFSYWIWLMVEIVKANWAVIKACLRSDLDIDPALVKIKTSCQSDLAKVTFANSITLTPGTVTVSVDGDKMLVHALYEDSAQPEAFIDMDRRSRVAIDGGGRS